MSPPALAADVTSAQPDGVAVTIYRDRPMTTAEMTQLGDGDTDGLALVVESRTLDLPAGRSRVRFEGVADGIVPQSAGAEGLPGTVVERDFDYDLLTPGALVARAVGETVQLVRTNPRTGHETREDAVVRSAPDGVVLDLGGRVEALGCGGEPERLVFDHAPIGLASRPTLSMIVEAPSAGRYAVRLSYLTVRMDWTADYIARVAPDGRTLALSGWITLTNRSGTGFTDAPTEVVAGHLARVPVGIPTARTPALEPACWPGQTTRGGWLGSSPEAPGGAMALAAPMAMRAMAVEERKLAIESRLGDYRLYTLAEPTTVAARQTKQVLFLSQPAVRFETVYGYTVTPPPLAAPDGAPLDGAPPMQAPEPARAVMRLLNTADRGLGRALPAGSVQLRQARPDLGGHELLVGEASLERDIAVGQPFELALGGATDVTVSERLASESRLSGDRLQRTFEVRVTNARSAAVAIEIRHDRAGAAGFKVITESAPHRQKNGDPLWRLALPPGGNQTLTYAVESAIR